MVALVTVTKQQHKHWALPTQVVPLSRPMVDAQFLNAVPTWFAIAEISRL